MDTSRIKIKIGEHEFEAEGPAESVQRQFDAFKDIVTSWANQPVPQVITQPITNQVVSNGTVAVPLEKILHVSGRVVSLTALPPSPEEAALLVMLGHRDLRNIQAVTGQEIGDGLAQSGRPVPRVDRVMERAIQEASVLKTGIKRSTRYRLTNQGLLKAMSIARDLIASLP